MRLSLKILWAIVAIVALIIVVVLALWEIPVSQTDIHKEISIDTYITKNTRDPSLKIK